MKLLTKQQALQAYLAGYTIVYDDKVSLNKLIRIHD